jgi:phosphatidylserine/phosphatidylglycerophosphate/cardiolipin synthase-like enzyme
MLCASDQRILRALSPWADIAGDVLSCLALPSYAGSFDESRLCGDAGLPSTQTIAVVGLLKELGKLGLVSERDDIRWQVTAKTGVLEKLVPLMDAIGFYRNNIHQDHTTASVVLTRPGQPSRLEDALSALGFVTGRMEITSEAFGDVAASARRRLVVMTPFLDEHGAKWLSDLLRRARPEVKKVVILRYLKNPSHPNYPVGFAILGPVLAELGASVHDYAVPRLVGGGTETFHAKVVLADDDYAYIGSANMNRASLEHSMEMGILARGDAARTVANVIDAIIQVCSGT